MQSVAASADWSERDQPRSTYPAPHPACSIHTMGSVSWKVEAHVAAGALKLAVGRTDVYQPWGHDPVYKQPQSGPMHAPPYYFKDVSRTVNDRYSHGNKEKTRIASESSRQTSCSSRT